MLNENKLVENDDNGQNSNKNVNGSNKASTFRRILPQFLAGSAKNLLLFDLGAVFGYQTIIIGNLLYAKSQPSFTDDESSWFASFLFIGQPIGCLLAAIFLEPIGRKTSMILVNVPLFLGWFIIATAQSVIVLYIGSIILGFGIGFIEAPTITYIGEISEADVRGIMTSYAEIIVGVGTLVVYFLGVFYDWRTTAYICTMIPMASAFAIAFIPESPIWLLAQNRKDDAEKALCWLRGWVKAEEVQKEFSELISYWDGKVATSNKSLPLESSVTENPTNRIEIIDTSVHSEICGNETSNIDRYGSFKSDKLSSLKNILSDLMETKMLHALLLMLGFFFFNSAAGANVAQTYAIPVFNELGFTVDAYQANVWTAVAVILGLLMLMVTVKYFGKRKIVLTSMLGCVVACVAVGYYALNPSTITGNSLWSTPFIIYTANNFVYGLGLGPVPWMYLSEIFPFRGRGVATGLSASMNYIFGFVVVKTFFILKNALTLAGTFFFYGFISLLGFIYLYILLPETEGKTLQDIEENQSRRVKVQKTRL